MRYQAPDRKTSYGGEFQLTRLSRPLLEQFYKLTASISSQKVDLDVAFQLFISRCMKLIVEKATRSLKLKNAVAPLQPLLKLYHCEKKMLLDTWLDML